MIIHILTMTTSSWQCLPAPIQASCNYSRDSMGLISSKLVPVSPLAQYPLLALELP